ncbi:sn-glycerol-3-phosphate ABC transporter ATP-binding protein UgpC [Candidatus Sumerlaeota bacterium]|nr:sn-glycerol-3-phosphate ABC transporter ATP-binding protein UgpC [Candidatus Sumerlaeota bacterium]
MARVRLSSVKKVYPGSVTAVDNFNLDVPDKEFCVFVGPSGCGKSTTLRMIAGLEDITGGDIFIGDRRVNDVAPKDRDIAMVFQNYALYPHMTVYNNMAFGLKLRKFPKKEIEKRVQEAAEILGITELLNRKPKALSGGERQRVAVGRAIVRKPQVFLFDEPLSNLDAKLRVQMRVEISKLHSRLQSTMIYVTHDQTEAMTMGDRIVVMKSGEIQQVDDPVHLYNKPTNKFVAGFIGSPGMNFIEGSVQIESGAAWFNEGAFRLQLPAEKYDALQNHNNEAVVLGMRPEDLWTPENAPEIQKTNHIEANIEVVEPMGSETYVYLNTGKSHFIARVGANVHPRAGERQTFALDVEKSHIFDAKTTQRLA